VENLALDSAILRSILQIFIFAESHCYQGQATSDSGRADRRCPNPPRPLGAGPSFRAWSRARHRRLVGRLRQL